MQHQQIEIDFAEPGLACARARRSTRLTRARWWFDQMRRVVDQAWDWGSGPPARPEQTRLALAQPNGKP